RDIIALACAFVGSTGFAVTMLQQDNLPGVEFVEGIYQAAYGAGSVPTLIVGAGTVLLLLPMCFVRSPQRDVSRLAAVFGALWIAFVLAAFLGNYPTPLLGYGSSSILGYMLCVLAFPPGAMR
ncbi:MAG: hypothetical protein AAFX02_09555, partial [Pseudomonadota bacterium]